MTAKTQSALDVNTIPDELSNRAQWVVWRSESRGGKPTKVPYAAATGSKASSTDPDTWATFDVAVEAFGRGDYSGIGFVFSHDDDFAGVDLDDCIDEAGDVAPEAQGVIDKLNSYTEISPSGRGVKIFLRGGLPIDGTGKKTTNVDGFGGIELYHRGRYFTVTGQHFADTPTTIEDRHDELNEVFRRFFPDRPTPTTRNTPTQNLADIPAGDNTERCKRYIEKCPDAISGNGGHDATLRAACEAFRFGLSDDEALDVLRWFNDHKTDEKWTDQELNHKLESAKGRVMANGEFGIRLQQSKPSCNGTQMAAQRNEGYRQTDIGNAERFADQHANRLRHCPKTGKWHHWTGKQWREDDTGATYRFGKETIRSMYSEAAKITDDQARSVFLKFIKSSEKRDRLNAMLALAGNEEKLVVSPDQFDADPMLLGAQNGVIDLRTGELLPHDRVRLITKLVNAEYRPDATCQKWLSFLNEIMHDSAELVGYLKRLCGVSLTGDVSEQILPIFYGSGANGKNVFFETIVGILGKYAAPAPDSLLTSRHNDEHPTEIAMLMGKRLIVANETEEGRSMRVNLIKRLTGDKELTGRFMRQDYFKFARTHKILLITNNLPKVRESKHAIWRRIKLVPFTVTIPEDKQDKHLAEKLKAEWPGILAWAVQGCLEWQRDGLGDPPDVTEATGEYRHNQNPLTEFLEDRCILSAEAQVSRTRLWASYQEWAKDVSERRLLDRSAFYAGVCGLVDVREAKIQERGSRLRGFEGIGVLALIRLDSDI